jgi:hypothetical protein
LLGLVGRGHDGLGEAELGGFLEAFLAALHRADFSGGATRGQAHNK